jgi:hypothetical protein
MNPKKLRRITALRVNLDLPRTCDAAFWKTRGKVSVPSFSCNFTRPLVYSRSPLRLLLNGKRQKKFTIRLLLPRAYCQFSKLSGAEYAGEAKLLLKLFTELTGQTRAGAGRPYGLFFVYIGTQATQLR